MKKNVWWFGLSVLVAVLFAASLALSSCTTTTAPTTETTTATTTETTTATTTETTTAPTTETTTATTAEVPQYGGTLTVIGYRTASPPQGWDVANDPFTTDYWVNPYAEYLLAGNIEGDGPRGNNSFAFQVQEGIPLQYLTGELCTSWSQPDPLTLIFNIRQGVMWAGNANIGMAPREFTAADAAFELNRYWKGPYGGSASYFASATATDQFTLVVKMTTYSPDWAYRIGFGFKSSMVPPEVVAAPNGGADNWKNQCGTGPFELTDYVAGSYASYTKNPNYWGSTTINGTQYQTPFVQTLIYPIIIDESTRISAIRTAKVDMSLEVPMTYKETLNSTSSDLQTFSYLKNSILCVGFNVANPEFSTANVRRALMIGTDLDTIGKAVYPGGYNIDAFPLSPGLGDVWTPIDQMPSSTQELFTYSPTTAKQMLAAAGYPNGFPLTLIIQANATYEDIAALLVSEWAQIGVTVTVQTDSVPSWSGVMVNHNFSDVFMSSTGNGSAATQLGANKVFPGAANTANWNDPHAVDLTNQANITTDPTAQNTIFKQLNLYILDQCPWIGFPAPDELGTYYPWVKNYYNEVEGGDYNYTPITRLIWIDQNLKKSLGY